MKKITLLAALLGSAYFANAQVGIGTPTPHASAILDVTATDKGVLIPRVALKNTTTVLSTGLVQEESLLVYNTDKVADVTPGFYYWNVNKWERIVNQSQLDTAITNVTNLQGDVTKIKALLDAAYGSNNLGDTATSDSFGGMVFTPATGTYGQAGYVAPVIEYVKWNATTSSYDKVNVTSQLIDLIHGNETKTKVATVEGKQFYFAEDYVGTIPTTIPTPLPDGMYLIDVIGDVVNNIEEIFTTTTNIVINEGKTNEQTFTTVQEYIEYISQNAMQEGVTKIVITDGQASFQTWNNTTNTWESVSNTSFSTIVKANQSLTDIAKTYPTTHVINYVYTAEPALDGTARTFTIDLTQDLIDQITNNQNVQNAITNLTLGNGSVFYNGTGSPISVGGVSIPADTFYLIKENGEGEAIDLGNIVVNEVVENFETIVNNGPVTVNGNQYTTIEQYIQKISNSYGNNVGYTTTVIAAGTPAGQLEIPANSFYYVNENGIKVEIPLNEIVYQGITQFTENQVVGVKNILGDNISTTEILTGDKYDNKPVYKKVLNTTVAAGTAVAGQVALADATKIISVHVFYSSANRKGTTASITDVELLNGNLNFNIGTGNMYQVLDSADQTNLEVIVEYIK